jgi:nitrous oxidase accessory protein NosD
MVLLANFGFPAIIYVNMTDGAACGAVGATYDLIQDAIDASSDGDTIIVCNETAPYEQNFEIYRSINIYGQESGVVLRPAIGNPIVIVNNDSINMTNFTIENANNNDAVIIYANKDNIYGNVIRNSLVGVEIRGGPRQFNNISGNAFSNISSIAIFLNASSSSINGTTVSYNTLTNGSGRAFYAHIDSGSISNLTFIGNNASGYEFGVDDDGSNNSIYANNTMTNCSSSFIADGMNNSLISGNSVSGSTNRVFTLTGCTSNTIRDNFVSNNTGSLNDTGFLIYHGSSYNVLINNTAQSSTPYGFHVLWDSNFNNLTNNTAAYNDNTGIVVEASYNNTLLNNSAYNNTGYAAFYIYTGGGNTLENNTAYYSPYGISVINTFNNTLSGNGAYSNIIDGVQLINATYCNLTGNNASHNTNDGFALYDSSNFNIFNSNIAEHNGHEDDTYAFNGILLDHSSGNNFTGDFLYNNTDLGIYLNTSANNTFNGSISSFNDIGGVYTFESDYNIFTNITANGNLGYGFYLQGSSGNNLSSVEVYDNFGYGIILEDYADNNTISDSNIYSSLIYGIELYNSSSNLINNTNVSLIYLAGVALTESSGGNELVGLNVSGNSAVGILISVEEQNSITNSVAAENELFDVLPLACFSGAIDNVTGSGDRSINYSNSSVNWQDFEASEILLCNANYSNLTNVTVHGSDEFNNNAFVIWDSNHLNITNSNSSGNYMGFYIYGGQNASLTNNTAMNTSFGGIVLEYSPNATIRGSTIGNNFADDTVVFGLGEERVGITLWDSQDVAMYNNSITDIWNSSAFLLEAQSSTEGFYNNTITNATIGIKVSDATIIITGFNYLHDIPAEGSDIYVEGDGYLNAMDHLMVTDYLNYSIYAQNIMAKSVNLSATALSINGTNFNVTPSGTLGARVLKTPGMYGALNVTSLGAGAAANVILSYNDSDVTDSGYSSIGMGAYSGSWANLGSTETDTIAHTVRKEGIASFSYLVPIAYTPAPASSSSHGKKDIDLSYAFNCSSGRLVVMASYSDNPISGLVITLFRGSRVEADRITDASGRAAFTLSQDGAYEALSETTSAYSSEDLILGTLRMCPAEGAAEEEDTTLEQAIAALGANQTGEEGQQVTSAEPQPEGPTREDALAAIAAAQSAISAAADAGKDVADAQAKLQQANDALAQNEYASAVQFAREAELLAGNAQAREIGTPAPGTQLPASGSQPAAGIDWALIIGVLAVLLAIAAGAYYLLAKRK